MSWLLLLSLQLGAPEQAVTEDTLREWSQNYRDSLVGTQFTFTTQEGLEPDGFIARQGTYASIPYKDGSLHRLDITKTFSADGLTTTTTQTLLQRPDGCYEIFQNNNGWVLEKHHSQLKEIYKEYGFRSDFMFIMMPVVRIASPFDESLSRERSGFSWGSRISLTKSKNEFQTSEFPWTNPKQVSVVSNYWLEDGCIKKLVIAKPDGTEAKIQEINYQLFNNRKYPRDSTIRVPGDDQRLSLVAEFSDVTACTKAPSYFSLTQFGMPEAEGIDLGRPTPVWVWLLAAAGGLMLLALLFRTLQQRALRKEST
ncbi:hypothetical protein [Tuwongella immobilis]|nr:hypothetical protein [Tuwongella immobilis]